MLYVLCRVGMSCGVDGVLWVVLCVMCGVWCVLCGVCRELRVVYGMSYVVCYVV